MSTQEHRPKIDRIGQLLAGRYRISALIAEGSAGVVYQAEHELMHKRVALKLLRADSEASTEEVARFRREAEAASHLEHPNVVAAKDFGRTDDGAFFLVMDYLQGTSLRTALESAPFTPTRAIRIARQIALALRCAHRGGIVHRDIKPENVMLVRTDENPELAKVLDFGIAGFNPEGERSSEEKPLTRVGSVLGTPAYMAPEQAVGEGASAASDLYALGIILFEMLAGRHPFDGEPAAMMSMHVVGRVPSIVERSPSVRVPEVLETLVRRLLEKAPKDRYESADALVEALDGAALACARIRPPRWLAAKALVSGAIARVHTELRAVRWSRRRALVTAGAGVLATTAVFAAASGLIRLVRSPAPPVESSGIVASAASAGANVATASSDRIRHAAVLGPPALEELSNEFPGDAAVLRELAFAYDGAGRSSDALRVVERAATGGAGRAGGAMTRDLVRIVVRAASRFEIADQAFRLLEGPLGPDGVEALLELSSDAGTTADTRERASRSLSKPSVRRSASEATAFLLDLRAATSCEARRQLLGRDGERADARALSALRALKNTRGCGRHGNDDCHRCLRGDPSLDRAIHAAEARAAQ